MGLTESFPTEHPSDYIGWKKLFASHRYSEEDIEHNIQIISWVALQECHPLSIDFLHRHAHRINWYLLSINPYITSEIIEHFADRFHLERVIQDKKISQAFATQLLLDEQTRTEVILDLLEFYIFPEHILRDVPIEWGIYNLRHPNFTSTFDWLIRFQDLSEDYMFDMHRYLNPELLERHQVFYGK